MDIPKNVLKNNLVRATVFQPQDIKAGEGYFDKKATAFLKQHQNTCAIYEAILIKKDDGMGDGFEIICPRCKKGEDITDVSNW